MHSRKILFLIEIPVFVAFSYILDSIPFLKFSIWAQGGSISLVMIPIFLLSFRWGLKGGLVGGALLGILKLILGRPYILVPLQGFLDYGVAFTVLGFAGLFAFKVQHAIKEGQYKHALWFVTLGVLTGSTLRFFVHFYAGAVFFGSAIDGMGKWLFSFLYNMSYIGPSILICALAVFYLIKKQPRLLILK